MGMLYGVDVIIGRFNPERTLEIIAAGNAACSFETFEPLTCEDGEITGQAEEAVDEPEREFAQNFARVVWAANGSYCDVTVVMVDMESPPPEEEYAFNEKDYTTLMAAHRQDC